MRIGSAPHNERVRDSPTCSQDHLQALHLTVATKNQWGGDAAYFSSGHPSFPSSGRQGRPRPAPACPARTGRTGDKLKTGRGIAHPKGGPESAERIPAGAAGRRPKHGERRFSACGGERAEPFLPSQWLEVWLTICVMRTSLRPTVVRAFDKLQEWDSHPTITELRSVIVIPLSHAAPKRA